MAVTAVSAFLRLLNDIDRSKRRSEVFFDFCELAYCALAKKACPDAQQRDALEAQYMQVVARYRDKDDIRKMPELMALSLETLGNGGVDFLGMVAAEIGALDSKLGQFFTPFEVSRMMAEISLTSVKDTIEENGFVTIQEPAAGAGGLLLAAADVIEGLGFDLTRHVWIEAVELSRPVYHMAYIQITARGLAGCVTCGNSLSLENFTSAYTAAAPLFITANGDPFTKQREEQARKYEEHRQKDLKLGADRAERLKRLGSEDVPEVNVQLGLFD